MCEGPACRGWISARRSIRKSKLCLREPFCPITSENASKTCIFSSFVLPSSCNRLNLVSLAYLWEREQKELLNDMIQSGLVARVIKTATMGLDRRHIGKTLNELQPYLLKIATLYGCNPCGEGGEYETFTVDCPLFQYRIELLEFVELMSCSDDVEIVTHSESMDAPVLLLVPKAWHLEKKEKEKENENEGETCLEGIDDTDILKSIELPRSINPPFDEIHNNNNDNWLNLESDEKDTDNIVVICPSQEKANELLELWKMKQSNPLL